MIGIYKKTSSLRLQNVSVPKNIISRNKWHMADLYVNLKKGVGLGNPLTLPCGQWERHGKGPHIGAAEEKIVWSCLFLARHAHQETNSTWDHKHDEQHHIVGQSEVVVQAWLQRGVWLSTVGEGGGDCA